MKSIYDAVDNAEMIARINSLTSESQALWGKMTVDQMFKHTTAALLIAFGEQKLKVNFIMRLLGRILKKKVFNSEAFKKNSPTAPEFIFTEHFDFETSKKELIDNFSQFANGKETIKTMNHPFWGKMTYEDWDKLMWKHLDHHLRQFGA